MNIISAFATVKPSRWNRCNLHHRMVIPPMMSVGHFMSTTIGESNMDQKSSTTQRYVATLSDDEFVQNSFGKLGLTKPLVSALVAQNILEPTPVQQGVIPRLLARENLVMAASTGSGKTLAYSLPTVQYLVGEELVGYKRLPQRPRCLVLVPTRELAKQVLQSIKHLGHYSKVSSSAIFGGEEYATQKKMLDRLVDVVVASPGRLMQHKLQGNVFFSHVNTVIIDEVDTMLTQGFGKDIRDILKSSLKKQEQGEGEVQIIMATATLTKAVKSLLLDVEGKGLLTDAIGAPLGTKKTSGTTESKITPIKVNVVEVDGVHRTLPHVKHNFEECKGKDKLMLLRDILDQSKTKMKRTLVFCNTIESSRAAEYGINDGMSVNAISYHGDMNSRERSDNLEKFKNGEESILVCTDIAARGLDIPDVDHVIMFDFPLNPVDYIHRAGRCGRAGRKGTVTSIVAKRDEVLADAIQACIVKGLPIDSLSSSKRDYLPTGKLSHIIKQRTATPNSDSSRQQQKKVLARKSLLQSKNSEKTTQDNKIPLASRNRNFAFNNKGNIKDHSQSSYKSKGGLSPHRSKSFNATSSFPREDKKTFGKKSVFTSRRPRSSSKPRPQRKGQF